ncbi:MAG: hypothetical protein AAF368_06090, partial [Planctomycetota bacterium]
MMAAERAAMAQLGLPTCFAPQQAKMKKALPETKACKRCGVVLPRATFAPQQWPRPQPTCSACAEQARAAQKQLEFYFGDKNWPKDAYLQGLADERGLVSVRSVAD